MLSVANQSIHDPSLTTLGEEQCRILARDFPYHNRIDCLVASPLRRTIHTCLLGFEQEAKKGLKIIALPEVQEVSGLPCDTGSNILTLRKEFRNVSLDFQFVDEGWTSKRGKWASDAEAVDKRAKAARQWLKARPEKEIVVVTHGGFLHFMTEDWSDSSRFKGTGWANTEFRSYQFVDEDGDNASIVETVESRKRRRGSEHPLSQTEQREFRAAQHKVWEASGYVPPSKA